MTNKVKNKVLYQLNFLKSIGYDYHDTLKLVTNEINKYSLPEDINTLKKVVSNCFLCELSKSRRNVLFGEGNTNAKLMFILDEPTASEDELNSFYAGKSGEQLSKMIENVLPLKKEDVFVTSMVKCKSLNGFDSTHYNSCHDYLFKQIELIDPILIVALGEKVYKFLKNENISFSKIRGQLQKFKDYDLLPMNSPSYLLRNPSSKKDAFQDMLKIKSILELN